MKNNRSAPVRIAILCIAFLVPFVMLVIALASFKGIQSSEASVEEKDTRYTSGFHETYRRYSAYNYGNYINEYGKDESLVPYHSTVFWLNLDNDKYLRFFAKAPKICEEDIAQTFVCRLDDLISGLPDTGVDESEFRRILADLGYNVVNNSVNTANTVYYPGSVYKTYTIANLETEEKYIFLLTNYPFLFGKTHASSDVLIYSDSTVWLLLNSLDDDEDKIYQKQETVDIIDCSSP